jgi:hypothetical protein
MTVVPAPGFTRSAQRSDEQHSGKKREAAEAATPMQLLDIQGYSYEPSEELLRNLNRILMISGGWILERRAISATNYEFTIEVELRSILDLYAGIIAAGIELTRANHLALTDLCTCRLHLLGSSELRQVIGMRLEVAFLTQLTLQNLLATGCTIV